MERRKRIVSRETRERIAAALRGKPHTAEHKKKISEGVKRYYKGETAEQRAARIAALKDYHARARQALAAQTAAEVREWFDSHV